MTVVKDSIMFSEFKIVKVCVHYVSLQSFVTIMVVKLFM